MRRHDPPPAPSQGRGKASPSPLGEGRGEGALRPAPAFAVVENVTPCIDGGRFPAKRVVGETVEVNASCFAHGHELVACVVRYRGPGGPWTEAPMVSLGNDRWSGAFEVDRIGRWEYEVICWVDHLTHWRDEFVRRVEPDDIRLNALMGAELIARCDLPEEECKDLAALATILRTETDIDRLRSAAADDDLFAMARRHEPRDGLARSAVYAIQVDRVRARFSTWYEIFPRSCSPVPGQHGTFADLDERLDEIAAMGFDVLYLPPIHPIGRDKRKGRNNAVVAAEGDVGSPWAIGAAEGGHTEILPELGTAADLRHLVMAARARGMELALDIAFQCSPEHPWVSEHPEWFAKRPDGSIQYAENPPKKYQDIYPLNFDTPAWKSLWEALREVFLHWCKEGIQVFRVDNPHTKPFAFWEWVIAEVKAEHPDTLFLSEAFTRPHVMHRLSKLGFTQSYTYFTWRVTKAELTEYFTELAQSGSREYFRPNVWPNTPDILPYHLQDAPLEAFRIRLVLAATLAASYGIYGPAFELGDNRPREPHSEEYLDSEKYQLRQWEGRRGGLTPLITTLNHVRREHAALQSDWSLEFHATDNDQLMAYSKRAGEDRVLVVVNLDPRNPQSGWVNVDATALGLDATASFTVTDRLGGESYTWKQGGNFVMLDPARTPAHVFTVG
jgi:starch synthase (maltosyl-transferring)